MRGSIRYRLVWHCLGLANKASQLCMQYLSRHRIHSQATRNVYEGLVGSIDYNGAQGQAYSAVVNSAFGENINMRNGNIPITNVNEGIANSQLPAGLYNDFALTNLRNGDIIASQGTALNLLGHNVLPLKQGK